MLNPRYSFIVPAYNSGECIGKCISSIVTQSFSSWELIVVDDGSNDATPGIVDGYAKSESRIRAIHTPHKGVAHARNVGLESARGEYVIFVDCDDWIESEYLKQVENSLKDDADINIMGISIDYCGEDGSVYYSEIKGCASYLYYSSDEIFDNVGFILKTMNMESACLKSYRRSFLNKYNIRFLNGMIVFEDFYFVLNCICSRPSVSLIPFIGYHYVVPYPYHPLKRRGGRDLYPSVHNLLEVLDELYGHLLCDSFSRKVLMQIMADKVGVVVAQTSNLPTLRQKKNSFLQINRDNVVRKHLDEILRHTGGRYRLEHRCTSAGFPLIAYLLHKYLR